MLPYHNTNNITEGQKEKQFYGLPIKHSTNMVMSIYEVIKAFTEIHKEIPRDHFFKVKIERQTVEETEN